MEGLGQIAKETGVRVQTHLSECRPEVNWVGELEPWAQNYTDVYEKTGILTDKTILAHGIYLDDSELSVIKSVGAGISHCPNSNNSIRLLKISKTYSIVKLVSLLKQQVNENVMTASQALLVITIT